MPQAPPPAFTVPCRQVWLGTSDDWIGSSDRPTKEQGSASEGEGDGGDAEIGEET